MDKKNRLIFLLMFGMLFYMNTTQAQMYNNGPLYIGANATTYMKTGEFSFGYFASTSTKKEDPKGVLSIASGAAIASGTSSQFVNGWVNTKGTGTFTFPVGVASPTNNYAPIQATPVSGSTGVSTAYFRASASLISSSLDETLTSISLNEYWKIIGSNATISLTWNEASAVPVTLNQLANITIAGFNISNNKWEAISSMVTVNSVLGGVSSVSTGSVTSSTPITLANYSAFSIGLKSLICPQLINPDGTAITYTFTEGFSLDPTLASVVTINSSGSTGSFSCNSLVLNADITLEDNEYIEVVNGITGTGKIIMSSQASLVQRANTATSPTIELTKKTRDMHQYDYIYWGVPVAENVITQLAFAKASLASQADAFDFKYKYVSGNIGGGWQNLTTTETGRGFITRVRPQAPFATTGVSDYINLKFTGTANNGDITLGITNNLSNPNGGTSHNLLANPYPSALDADKFLQGNLDIDGVIYIWKQQTASVGSVTPYSQADYIAYTRAGTTSPSSIMDTFSGKIASGQGFLVKALDIDKTVTFTNCMRLTDSNTDFNKFSETTATMDRYKVNMVGDNGVFSQIVVSYLPQCTLGYDRMYDAGRNSVSTAQLYSIMENDGRKLAINARPSFADTDVVPLGVSKTGTVSENFTLSIQEKEGVFAVNTPIYVHDLLLNTYNDLTISDYTFSSDVTLLNTRFELVYQNGTLNNPDFENSKATAFIKNGLLSVSATLEMKSIAVYDILGRNVLTISTNGLKTMTNLFPFTEGIYIAKITMQNGVIATTKLINKN